MNRIIRELESEESELDHELEILQIQVLCKSIRLQKVKEDLAFYRQLAVEKTWIGRAFA